MLVFERYGGIHWNVAGGDQDCWCDHGLRDSDGRVCVRANYYEKSIFERSLTYVK